MVICHRSSKWMRVAVIALVALAPLRATADRPGRNGGRAPTPVSRGAPHVDSAWLVGTWQAESPRNAYQVKVSWSERSQHYEGVLVGQGAEWARGGRVLGELCWTIEEAPNGFVLSELWHRGRNGRDAWRRMLVRLDATTLPRLVAGGTAFVKIDGAQPPTAQPPAPAAAAPGPAPAPGPAGAAQAPQTPVAAGGDSPHLPDLQDVLKEWRSREPAETVVLNEAAVVVLTEFADTIAPQVGPFNRTIPVSDYRAWLKSRPSQERSEDTKLLLANLSFRHKVLYVYLDPKWIAMYESSPQFQALKSAAERRPAEEKARAEEVKRHVTVFGIALGMAPDRCSIKRKPPCLDDHSDAFVSAVVEFGEAADQTWQPALLGDRAYLVVDERPEWLWPPAAPIVAHVWNGNVVAVRMRANANHGDFRNDLIEKFGRRPNWEKDIQFRNAYGKTWTAPNLEWETNGIHVQFVPDGKQQDESAVGLLVIELDVAYKARRESEVKGRKNRPKM